MTNHVVRKPTKEDVEYLIENIRTEDAAEIDALNGATIREVLENTEGLYDNSKTWEADGRVVCIFGVTPVNGPMKVGVVWLLATNDFHKYTKKFALNCQQVLKEMINEYGYLFNYIHSENEESIEWLKWLGFKVLDPIPLGHKGANFHKFELKNV